MIVSLSALLVLVGLGGAAWRGRRKKTRLHPDEDFVST